MARPYLGAMPLKGKYRFMRDVSVRGSISDFKVVIEQAGPHRWTFAILAAICTAGIFSLLVGYEQPGLPRPPVVTYITSWPADRTEAEIIASNIENQKRKERLAAEQARREEEVRQIYKTIGRLSGMDVEAIEKKAEAERAAERAAAAKATEAMRARAEAAAQSAPAAPE
ncbi:MAG TPA: hypothetical protein PKD92_00950 [Novosphingobium sp.]|nr:hypothetical protein [Novosphingobium sp.]